MESSEGEELLARVIDSVVENRRALRTLQNDPVLFRLLGEHQPSQRLWVRLFSALVGDEVGAPARVRAAVVSAALGAVAHPFVADVDDEVLRNELLLVIRGLISVPP